MLSNKTYSFITCKLLNKGFEENVKRLDLLSGWVLYRCVPARAERAARGHFPSAVRRDGTLWSNTLVQTLRQKTGNCKCNACHFKFMWSEDMYWLCGTDSLCIGMWMYWYIIHVCSCMPNGMYLALVGNGLYFDTSGGLWLFDVNK